MWLLHIPLIFFYGISRAVWFWRVKFEGAGLVCERLSQRTARIQDSIEAWCGLALPKDVYDIRKNWRWPHEKLALFHVVPMNVTENMSFKMRLASMNWNDKPNLLKVCCHSAAEAVPATPALHVGSHRGPVRFNLVQNTTGLKHGVPKNSRFNGMALLTT